MNRTTLEQWLTLKEVVDSGSYARAADKLNRSQSTISYTLSTLQQRLGIKLLRTAGRRAELTAEGEQLLAQARVLLSGFDGLEQNARLLLQGSPLRINIRIDAMLPKSIVFNALKKFNQIYPQVHIELVEILRGETANALENAGGDIFLCADLPEQWVSESEYLLDIPFVAVAAKQHPLLQLGVPLTFAQLSPYRRVVISERLTRDKRPSRQLESQPLWSFSTFDSALQAVRSAVGYGWLPLELINPYLQQGELVTLPLITGSTRYTPIFLVFGKPQSQVGPVLREFADLIREQVKGWK
ncbi:LysR family transcriptional regulator [Acerihabitans sp. TG2]|uniref:LysR family transcriptional regulator n=1 Tax=Acerihabitans sp. TG2 TaxID=3096008 RepID=UPI002B227C1D|nr:LysR family transcriptional regulator [Acerihabitans sp. TG2]MEA9391284.1 LysR family transcriptional regulator [Acerihabitans sp. TG2]